MNVRTLLETLRNHGLLTELPLDPNSGVEEAVTLLTGAYEIKENFLLVDPASLVTG